MAGRSYLPKRIKECQLQNIFNQRMPAMKIKFPECGIVEEQITRKDQSEGIKRVRAQGDSFESYPRRQGTIPWLRVTLSPDTACRFARPEAGLAPQKAQGYFNSPQLSPVLTSTSSGTRRSIAPLHLLCDQGGHLFDFSGRYLEQELIVHLHEHARLLSLLSSGDRRWQSSRS